MALLKDQLRSRRLSTSGLKAKLVQRLTDAVTQEATTAAAAAAAEASKGSKGGAVTAMDEEPSTLAPEVKSLVEKIFDGDMLTRSLRAQRFDTDKMPLGKLKKRTILEGYEALKDQP